MLSRPSRLVAVVLTRSRRSSLSSRRASGGAPNDCRIDTGMPALEPGVKMTQSVFSFSIRIRSGVSPDEASPFFQMSA